MGGKGPDGGGAQRAAAGAAGPGAPGAERVTSVTNHEHHTEERRVEKKTTTQEILVDNRRPRTAVRLRQPYKRATGAGGASTSRLAEPRGYHNSDRARLMR